MGWGGGDGMGGGGGVEGWRGGGIIVWGSGRSLYASRNYQGSVGRMMEGEQGLPGPFLRGLDMLASSGASSRRFEPWRWPCRMVGRSVCRVWCVVYCITTFQRNLLDMVRTLAKYPTG